MNAECGMEKGERLRPAGAHLRDALCVTLPAARAALAETQAERRDRIKATVAVVILALFVGIVIGAARERVLANRAAFVWTHHVVAEDDGYGQP